MAEEDIFGHDMLRACLKGMGVNFLTDQDGDFMAQFGYEQQWGRALGVYFIVAGPSGEIFQILVQSSQPCGQDQWDEAVLFCNDWNSSRRWPKASVSLPGEAGTNPPSIVLAESFPMPYPCPADYVATLIAITIDSASDFWREAHARNL